MIRRPPSSGRFPKRYSQHTVDNVVDAVVSLTSQHSRTADTVSRLANDRTAIDAAVHSAMASKLPCAPEHLVSLSVMHAVVQDMQATIADQLEETVGALEVRVEEVEQDLYGDA